jgi:hypothetical protein
MSSLAVESGPCEHMRCGTTEAYPDTQTPHTLLAPPRRQRDSGRGVARDFGQFAHSSLAQRPTQSAARR